MKVLIADDEIQVRKGLRMKVDWEAEGFVIAGEASNGKEALEMLKAIEFDLVITDMRMPIMDGLELAKVCQREFPAVRILVLSGYSDFEYVRGSMKEGVKDYLLKPVAPEELREALLKIKKEAAIERERREEASQLRMLFNSHLREVQEQFLLYLVKEEWLQSHMVMERLKQLQLGVLADEEQSVQFISVEARESKEMEKRMEELWQPFRLLSRELAESAEVTFSFYDPNYGGIIHFIRQLPAAGCKEYHTKFINSLQIKVKSALGLETVIGIGRPVAGYSRFKNGYISSMLAWSRSRIGPYSQVIDGNEAGEDPFEFSPEIEKKLVNSLENANLPSFHANVSSLLGGRDNQSILSFSFVSNRVLFLLGSIARKYDIETNEIQQRMWICQQTIWELNSCEKVIEQLNSLAVTISDKVRAARFSNGRLILEGVRQYLDQHYASDISLGMLSDMFHINSAHLSETFKNHFGQNLSDYLVNLRMKKACEFLKDQQLKIIDVAYLTGYSNPGYFSTVFKKHFGLTPAEYRQMQ